jgi:hypothetical protein
VLTVPSQWPNADGDDAHPAIHRVDTDKPRRARRRHSSSNLVDVGEGSPGEAMRQIISVTEQARRTLALLGRPNDLLLWSRGARHPMFSNATVGLRDAIDAWAREALPDLPTGLNSRLLRHTAQVLYGRPRHNTRAVQAQHYLRRDEQVIADSRDVVAAGLEDAVRHARATVQMRVIAAQGVDGHDDARVIAERAGLPLDVFPPGGLRDSGYGGGRVRGRRAQPAQRREPVPGVLPAVLRVPQRFGDRAPLAADRLPLPGP